jgi:phosphoglycolate phosphatase-like HAD superfamily hydrolase
MIKGILFDKDGTLLEFHSTQHSIYAKVFACLEERYQLPDALLQALSEALGHLPDRLTPDSLLQFSTNPQIAQALFDRSEKYAAEHHWQLPFDENDLLELIEELSLSDDVPYTALPGVPETLRYLKRKGYQLGIATVDSLATTLAGLKKTGILDYFDYLGTGEESKPKPDAFLADKFCSQCGLKADEILIVGDGLNDMRFAENAGAAFIGLDAPGDSASVFKEHGRWSVSQISEIIEAFNL